MGYRLFCVIAVLALGASNANAKPEQFAEANKANEVRKLNRAYLKTGLTAPSKRTTKIEEAFGILIAELTILGGIDERVAQKVNPLLQVPEGVEITPETGWIFSLMHRYPELKGVFFPSTNLEDN